jgi:phage head maturation protease
MDALVVNFAARTIAGIAVPYDRPAQAGSRRFWFQRGWVQTTGPVWLLRDHDHAQRVGRASELVDTAAGLRVLLRVHRSPAGDLVLTGAATGALGLSPGIDGKTVHTVRGTQMVTAAALLELSLTANPAFETR